MQKNVFDYLEYSFTRLFSKQFWNIVGSSLIISFALTLAIALSLVVWWHYLYSSIESDMITLDSWLYIVLAGLIYLLIISMAAILGRGWLAIVIPIRSIDPTKHMDFVSDYRLFREHISTYLWYISWYALSLMTLFLSYPIVLVLMSAIHASLGWIFGIGGIVGILYALTRLYLSWYHMLSEWSGKMRTFRESISLSRWKVWKIFWRVFAFSLIVTIVSTLIESTMSGIFSAIGSGSLMNESALIIEKNSEDLRQILSGIWGILGDNGPKFTLSLVLFGIFYTLSSVLSRAMYHIFYVRYYLDIREEHENENSWIKSILYPSSHSQNP